MNWGTTRFEEFFSAVNQGRSPYSWQRRLAERVVTTGVWPDVIGAPTGAGKSSVVDVHVYALAATADTSSLPPRRLAVVVNRRALVDSHSERAEMLRGMLLEAHAGILAEIAERLRMLSGTADPLLVTSLRGGSPSDPRWVDEPRLPAVIAATPDMWGSRLLFRGYGTSHHARPREAALLAVDAVMVLDEAHLNRQLLQTARDAAEQTASIPMVLGGMSGLQVVATTATPDIGDGTHDEKIEGVRAVDLDHDAGLRTALTTPKSIRVIQTSDGPGRGAASERYARLMADQAVELASEVDRSAGLPATVLCVVNSVKVAIDLTTQLKSRVDPVSVVCWVGRLRPMDLDRLRRAQPDLFTVAGDDSVAFLVATQTVEVGIDIDTAGLLTELAPGSSLTQRFGRVNRRGLRPNAPIRVVVPEGDIRADRPPYLAVDLQAAKNWLATSPGDVSPWAITSAPAPAESLRRRVLSSLNREELDVLAQTSSPLVVEPDLDFWLRDDLDDDEDPVGFVLRDNLPDDDGITLTLLRETPPDDREIFPARIATARQALRRVLGADTLARAFRWRSGELEQVRDEADLRPGDQVLIDSVHSITRQEVVVDDPPAIAEQPKTVWGSEGVQVVLPGNPNQSWLDSLAGTTPEEAQQWVNEQPGFDDVQVVLPVGLANGWGELPWIVLKPRRRAEQDAEVRQEWTKSAEPVLLHRHQEAVAARSASMAQQLGLGKSLVDAMYAAGLHHDDGKAETGFQKVLWGSRWSSRQPLLAKSVERSAQQVQRRRGGAGWRHEQLSAVHAGHAYAGSAHRDLVLRLVGTSHGRGRPFFPSGADGLLREPVNEDIAAIAQDLFATGAGWSEILERTDRAYGGPWGIAFLEAVLRAADGQVSGEGS